MALNADEEIKRIRGESNYYSLLNVSNGSSEAELKKAFRKLALLLHPDKCQAAGAEEAFKKVSSAYQCLANASSRRTYDVSGRDDDSGGGGGFPRGGPGGVDLDELLKQFMREAQENGGGMGGGMAGRPFVFHFGGPGGYQGSMFQNGRGGERQRSGGGANYVIIGLIILGIYLVYSFFALLMRNVTRAALAGLAVLISSRLNFLNANQRALVRNILFVVIVLCPTDLISFSSNKTS